MKKLAVIGSINMDVVTSVERFPQPGETLTGTSFSTIPGGKGANQAVALGRLDMPVWMAGSVGDDAFGESYLRNFRENGVNTDLVRICKGQTTGTASIEVNAEGETTSSSYLPPTAHAICNGWRKRFPLWPTAISSCCSTKSPCQWYSRPSVAYMRWARWSSSTPRPLRRCRRMYWPCLTTSPQMNPNCAPLPPH